MLAEQQGLDLIMTINQDKINTILWMACDTFRSAVDPSKYKNYILVMLFVKYISVVSLALRPVLSVGRTYLLPMSLGISSCRLDYYSFYKPHHLPSTSKISHYRSV